MASYLDALNPIDRFAGVGPGSPKNFNYPRPETSGLNYNLTPPTYSSPPRSVQSVPMGNAYSGMPANYWAGGPTASTVPALDAINRLTPAMTAQRDPVGTPSASGIPDMRGVPFGLGSRDTPARQTAGQMFLSAYLGGQAPAASAPYSGGGMLAPGAGDPWAGVATPGAAGRKQGRTQPQRGPVAIPQPMRESTDGYIYQNGKAVGKADWAKDLTPSQQYDTANQRGRDRAIAKSSNPSKTAARASLAARWGFD